jgi:hypothetical protein
MSRFGVHHRWYDDMLVVVAIVTAFRLRKEIEERFHATLTSGDCV